MTHKWEALNLKEAPPDVSGTFTLTAPPGCDIWRPTPERNVFDAPCVITKIKASSFKSITATVTADWKTRYDQAGIVMVFPGSQIDQAKDCKSWIKAGIENEDGEAKLGVVGAYAFSDWSLSPTLTESSTASFKFERSKSALWIYAVHEGKKVGLREVTWAFLEDRAGDAELWVGVYVAKPTADADSIEAGLRVEFKDVKLEIE